VHSLLAEYERINATHKLLAICDDFAGQYDIVFIAEKSKSLVHTSLKRRFKYNDMRACNFYIMVN